jgi:hypothetical protein
LTHDRRHPYGGGGKDKVAIGTAAAGAGIRPLQQPKMYRHRGGRECRSDSQIPR